MHLVVPQDCCFACWKVNAAVAVCSEELHVLGLPPPHSLLQHSLHLHSTPPPHLPVHPVATTQHSVYMYALMTWFICYNCSTLFNAFREFFRMQLYRPIIQMKPTLQLKHQNILI